MNPKGSPASLHNKYESQSDKPGRPLSRFAEGGRAEQKRPFRDRYFNRKAVEQTVFFILPQRDLGPRAKTVAIALAKRVGKNESCWPSINTISRDTGLSRVTVNKALKELQEGGYITKTPGNSKRRSTTYTLVWI